MNERARIAILALALLALLGGSPGAATAEEESFKIGSGDTMRTILEARVGEQLYIQTKNGSEINGKLAAVGDHVIQISRVAGRTYYDAVIGIGDVETVMMRVREIDKR